MLRSSDHKVSYFDTFRLACYPANQINQQGKNEGHQQHSFPGEKYLNSGSGALLLSFDWVG